MPGGDRPALLHDGVRRDMNDVLFGVDPRDLSIPALVWAADEAVRRGLRLRLVAAVPPAHDRFLYDALGPRSALRIRAESALVNAEDLVRELHDGLWTATELVDGAPATVLQDRTAHAVLAVVGSRRLGRAAEVLSEGSVVMPLVARADCPVVVVRAPEHRPVHPLTLVVGVDGGTACQEAVAFAVEEASLREARLRAVMVRPRSRLSQDDADEGLVEWQRVSACMAGWAERYPDIGIAEEVLRGHPAEQLALASQEAVLLVVGRRGRGGCTGMRLGSTVHGLLHRADCPVIIVPCHSREGGNDDSAGAERPLPERPDRPRRTAPLGTAPHNIAGRRVGYGVGPGSVCTDPPPVGSDPGPPGSPWIPVRGAEQWPETRWNAGTASSPTSTTGPTGNSPDCPDGGPGRQPTPSR
ncbi:universal stress protein [Streptomyces venezuelae]|uniref:universal stress protein n=1 Tax=Streptomyces gardneri TaxID=66892 RepID=UPI002E7B4DE5|nr:universal stress protein [Streptomyces gardneri]WRK35177.1 universal stress protein [Streptomyces venezuelae]